ncbi:MAG: 50S ribosome-binding GTPase [Desulfurococcales archaeon]|nr:50S ribosome-binding GTPase [Desulfurococcales archaeon]
MKAKTYSNPAEVAKNIHVPTYEEILERIKAKYPRRAKTLFDKEQTALQRTYDIVMAKTDFVRELAKLLDSLHPFYWRLIEIEFDRSQVHRSLSCISKSRKIAAKLFGKYRFLLMAAENRRELVRTGSEGRGRILSLFKKCRRSLYYLRDLVVFIQKLPSIDPYLPTIIVAGPPSSGKSTLVRNATRAKPKVASYPFTTKNIHIGHFTIGDDKIQVIDTPGLLDRPVEEMNNVERKAVAAMKELHGVILFLVDVSGEAYADLDRQFNLLSNITKITPDKKIYLALNKIDEADQDLLERAREKASLLLGKGKIVDYYEMSTLDLDQVRNLVYKIGLTLISSNRSHK